MTTWGPSLRFKQALILSLLCHLVALVLVGFEWRPIVITAPAELEVVLVNHATSSIPVGATRLAQNSLNGGGEVDDDRHRSSPLAASNAQLAEAARREQQRVAELEKESEKLLAQLKAQASIEVKEVDTQAAPTANAVHGLNRTPSKAAPVFSGMGTVERGEAMTRDAGEIAREFEAYQKRPRRVAVGGRTRAYIFASYEDNYRARIERTGTLNYPMLHGGEPLYGKVRLTVSIDAAGLVKGIQINTSSGEEVLDRAAVEIVHRAAPFGAFSLAMKKKADILDITRTFTFKRDSITLKAD